MMHFLMLIYLVKVLGDFLSPLDELWGYNFTQSVGKNCGSTDYFVIGSVDVSPWPPTAGEKAQVTMSGKFKTSEYVQEVVIGNCYNSMLWNYYPLDINKNYQKGQEATFKVNVIFPTKHGKYLANIQLTAGDHICCWQAEYNIS